MPPSNLQGLNLVHPAKVIEQSNLDLSASAFPDLTAQLDLWTNLAFDSDEPLNRKDDERYIGGGIASNDGEEEEDAAIAEGTAMHDGHVNVVTGRNVSEGNSTIDSNNANSKSLSPPSFDINNFLAGFGIDPFAIPPSQPQTTIAPSLAQLLALHPSPAAAFPSAVTRHQPIESEKTLPYAVPQREETPSSPTKRPRTRNVSVSSSTLDSGEYPDDAPNTTTPLSAAEDKRRRNTAASARFRLKKKEREAALETKAKELEGRVSELERECEGLRRENGWLKGLVVGVTGASTASPPHVAGTKRARDSDVDSASA